MRDFLPAITLGAGLIAGLFLSTVYMQDRTGQYVVISSPWSSRTAALGHVADAGGAVVDVGRFSNIVIAASKNRDFAHAAHRSGAWIILPATRVAGCEGGKPERVST